VFGGVPAEEARPLLNTSPEGFGAEDVAIANLVNRATGYADVYGNPVNATGLASLTPAQISQAYQASVAANQASGGAPADTAATSFKEGGIASLANEAREVRGAGRYGDDQLVHVNSEELGIMQQMFGKPTINPQTGMPEFFFKKLKKIFKKIVRPIARIAQFVIPFIPGIGIPYQALFSGIAAGLSSKDKFFDFKKGLTAGALSYGAGSALKGLKGAANAGVKAATNAADDVAAAGLTSAGPSSAASALNRSVAVGSVPQAVAARTNVLLPGGGISGGVPADVSSIGLGSMLPTSAAAAATPNALGAAGRSSLASIGSTVDDALAASVPTAGQNAGQTAAASLASRAADIGSRTFSDVNQAITGAGRILGGDEAATAAFQNAFGQKELLALGAGLSGSQAISEQEKFEEQERARLEDEERKRREYEAYVADIMQQNPFVMSAAQGGEVDDEPGYDMARGGKVLPPRYLNGPGDGMSDSINANIDGKRPARLADGEFVIPADVVSHLGNGSSKAGAKKLYAMMDRVRKARTGTARQGRQINSTRFMPA
jgi:hypothetical protein